MPNKSLTSWIFGNLEFDVRAIQDPQVWKKDFCFHILDLNLKSSYEIASLFHMYKDMGERIPGEQDTLSLITEGPSQGPSNSQKILCTPPPPRTPKK